MKDIPESALPSSRYPKLAGLIAAPFTPFDASGAVVCDKIKAYAKYLQESGVSGVFVCGTTGEGVSLTINERRRVLEAWVDAAGGRMKIIAHVGHSSGADSCSLVAHALECGVDAVAAMPSSRMVAPNLETLVRSVGAIAEAADSLPFYYYHIPSVSGVSFPMYRFLELAADRIPNLAGIKFTYEDLLDFQMCQRVLDGAFDIAFGRDECLLAALALGAQAAVGSTYNFAAPLYLAVMDAFSRGDMVEAQRLQGIAAQLISVCIDFGGLPAIKAAMAFVGHDMGPMRLPMRSLSHAESTRFRGTLEDAGLLSAITEPQQFRATRASGKALQSV